MNYFGMVSLLNGIISLFAGLYVFGKDRKNPLHLSFTYFSLSVALWAIFYAMWQSQGDKAGALFFMRLAMAPCYYIPFAFLWFVLTLVEDENRRKYLPLCVVIPSGFLIFNFSKLAVKDVVPRLFFPYWPTPGLLMHAFVILFFSIVIYSFFLLFRAWFSASGMRRWQLRWIATTVLAGWVGGSTNWFLWYDIPIPPFANFFVAVFFMLLAYAVMRRRLFDVDSLSDMIQEAKLSAIGTLAAGINHEIKNPLFAAKGFAESLLADIDEGLLHRGSIEERDRRLRELLRKITEQISGALEIARQFTEFSKPRPGPAVRETVCVREVVEGVLSFIGHVLDVGKIRVEKELNPDAVALADRKHLEEIFLNLIANACQAMPRGGTLRIADEEEKGRLRIHISDTGEGISRDKVKRIFDPFFSTKGEKGTGLGLYIVRKLVERNAGRVKVVSQVGKGTTFTLEFYGKDSID